MKKKGAARGRRGLEKLDSERTRRGFTGVPLIRREERRRVPRGGRCLVIVHLPITSPTRIIHAVHTDTSLFTDTLSAAQVQRDYLMRAQRGSLYRFDIRRVCRTEERRAHLFLLPPFLF